MSSFPKRDHHADPHQRGCIAVAVDAFETVALNDGEGEAHASRQTILREVRTLRAENAAIRSDIAELRTVLREQRGS